MTVCARSPCSKCSPSKFSVNILRRSSPTPAAMSAQGAVIFRGVMSAAPEDAQAHCSAPPLQASFRLPRLSRDVEAVTRPRAPLLDMKWEQPSESGAVADFAVDVWDEVEVKVEEEEEPIEVAEVPQGLCARLSAVRILPQAPATVKPRGPGRPRGSKSRPRVEPQFDKSAPPERSEAKKASARISSRK